MSAEQFIMLLWLFLFYASMLNVHYPSGLNHDLSTWPQAALPARQRQ